MISKLIRKIRSYLASQKEKMLLSQKEKMLLKDLQPQEYKLIDNIKNKRLTYLSRLKLANIVYTINSINKSETKGIFIEAGCALGGSAILISKLKNINSIFIVFDVFGMIPPPTKEDTEDVHKRYKTIVEGESAGLGDDLYYGYEDDLYDKVISNIKGFDISLKERNIKLIKGLVQDTMDITELVAFAHIDVDWYEPVKTCLQQIWPNLVKGGSIILDDYHYWGGCRKATDEYLKEYVGQFSMQDRFGSMKLTKIK